MRDYAQGPADVESYYRISQALMNGDTAEIKLKASKVALLVIAYCELVVACNEGVIG
jgi:hypothetical protein